MDYGNQLEHFSLRWNNFNDNMKTGFHDLLRREDFVDVTIAAEGKLIQAHKMVLSICSPYFKNIFKTNPCQHPIVFLKDVSHKELSGILQFMYLGEVSVQQEELGRFLKTAEALQIKGLTGEEKDKDDKDVPTSSTPKENHKIQNKNKITKSIQSDPPDKGNVVSCKRPKIQSSTNNNKAPFSSQNSTISNHDSHEGMDLVIPKTEPIEEEYSDVDSERGITKEGSMERSDPLSQLLDGNSELREDCNASPNTASTSAVAPDLFSSIPSEQFTMSDSNQEIRFVMSPRMRPCLVFHNYLYIKDHVGLASPGQAKTVYWRCKDVACRARCIQSDFRFRLKRNTFHQHPPNIDASYSPIQTEKAYDIIQHLK